MSDYNHRYLVPTFNGLVAQIGLSACVSIVCIGVFEWNRRKKTLQYLYSPRCSLKVNPSPPMSMKFLGWVMPTLRIPEEFFIANVGLDAVMFLRFLKMCLQFCVFNAIVLGIILLPIHYTGAGGLSEVPRFSIANVSDDSDVLWAHVVLTYVVTISWTFLLFKNYWQWMDLRREYTLQRIRQGEIAERSIFISRLPSNLRTDDALKQYFESLKMGPVESATVVQHCGRLSQKIDRRESTLNMLEKAHIELAQTVLERVKHGKFAEPKSTNMHGSFLMPPKPDTTTVVQTMDPPSLESIVQDLYQDKKWYRKFRKSIFAHKREPRIARPLLNIPLSALAHHSDIVDICVDSGKDAMKMESTKSLRQSQFTIWNALAELDRDLLDEFQPTRPANRFKGSNRIASIDYLVKKYNRLDRKVGELRDGSLQYKSTSFGFVTFKHHLSAQLCAQAKIDSRPQGLSVQLAMEPRDVLWSNLTAGFRNRFTRSVVVNLSIWSLIIFWIFPTSSFLLLTSLGALSSRFKFLEPILKASPLMQSLLQNVLPIVFVTVFLALAPAIILEISKQELPVSHSALETNVLRRYYHFLIFNVLFVFMIGTAILKSIITLIQQPTNIFTLLAESLPSGSTFFIFYTVFNTCAHALELVQVWAQLVVHIFVTSLKMTPTPRALQRSTAPWTFQYYYYYPHNILAIVITFIYSIISPLILIAAVVHFAFAILVFKYQFAYCYVRKYENSGKFFRLVFQYSTDGLIIFQITMVGVLWLKKALVGGFFIVALIGFTVYFKILCNDLFKSRSKFLPLDTGLRNFDDTSTCTMNEIPASYEHASGHSSAILKRELRRRNVNGQEEETDSKSIMTEVEIDQGQESHNGVAGSGPCIDIQVASPTSLYDDQHECGSERSEKLTLSASPSSSYTTTINADHRPKSEIEIDEGKSYRGSAGLGISVSGIIGDLQDLRRQGSSSRNSVASRVHTKDEFEQSSVSRQSSTRDIKLFTVGDDPLDGPQGYVETAETGVNFCGDGDVSNAGGFLDEDGFYLESYGNQNSKMVQLASHFDHTPSKSVYQDHTSDFETYVHPALLKPLNRKLWLPRNPLYMHWDLDDTLEVDFALNSTVSGNKLELRHRNKDDNQQIQQTSGLSGEQYRQRYTRRKNTIGSNLDDGTGVATTFNWEGCLGESSPSNNVAHIPGQNSGTEGQPPLQNPSSRNGSKARLCNHIVMSDTELNVTANAMERSTSAASVHLFSPSSPPEELLLPSPKFLESEPSTNGTRYKRSASMPPAPPTAEELRAMQTSGNGGSNNRSLTPTPTMFSTGSPSLSAQHPYNLPAGVRKGSFGSQAHLPSSSSANQSPRVAFAKRTPSPLNVRSTMFSRRVMHRHTISNGQGNNIHQGPLGNTHLAQVGANTSVNVSSGMAGTNLGTGTGAEVLGAGGTTTANKNAVAGSRPRRGTVRETAGAFFNMIFGDSDDNVLEANENPRFGYETGGIWKSRRGGTDNNDDDDDDDDDDDESSHGSQMKEIPYTTINMADVDVMGVAGANVGTPDSQNKALGNLSLAYPSHLDLLESNDGSSSTEEADKGSNKPSSRQNRSGSFAVKGTKMK
ncbi:hypothetical protein BGX21_010296 [Mortierella sp. AD011]|nr:hypothetical protein BGX20_010161 [Mortierella sp. AD010]KAF9394602.1 hypothetical protein BGX21_010296 [Mortierella sp. AD011]